MDMTRKDELCQFGMFCGMAKDTQHLNIAWVGSSRRVRGMKLDVVALQILLGSALFTLSSFLNNLIYCFARRMRSFADAIFPVWMVGFSHVAASGRCQTFDGTIFSGSTPSFANLKRFSALLACAINHCASALWFQFQRAFARTSVCFSSHMGMRPNKNFFASGACQCGMTATFNLSLETSHG